MENTLDEPTPSPIKKRNPFIAFFASLIIPGLGQLYNGEQKKAFIFWLLTIVPIFIFGLARVATYFYGFVTLLFLQVSFVLYISIQAFIKARKQKNYELKSCNQAFYYLIFAAIVLGTSFNFNFFSILGIQTFHIPSPSSYPTLQIKDRLVADLNTYKNAPIDYGDIVIFNVKEKNDEAPIIYTFRIVGLPNDKMEIRNNIAVINGKESPSNFIKDTIVDDFEVKEFTERLPNGHQHRIYKFKQSMDSTMSTIKDIVVPSDCYYVMGDNRDNAMDSRYIGYIKREDILGRMVFTYWGKTNDRINIDLRNK